MKFDEIVILTIGCLMMVGSIYYACRYYLYERNTGPISCLSSRVSILPPPTPPVTSGLNPVSTIHGISHTRVTPKDIETEFL